MKKGFWTTDGFAGLVFTLVFLLVSFVLYPDAFQGLERYAYDVGVRSAKRLPSERVAVVAIDDESIQNIGRWPWPRDIHARMIEQLRAGGAKVIGNTILYSEPQVDPGLVQINQLLQFVEGSSLSVLLPRPSASIEPATAPEPPADTATPVADAQTLPAPEPAAAAPPQGDVAVLVGKLLAARDALNTDQKLAASMRAAGNVVQAMTFVLGQPQGRPDAPLPEYVLRNAITQVHGSPDAGSPIPTQAALPPIPPVGEAASGIGHLSSTLDVDGAQRFEPLVLEHFGAYLPSFSLLLAARVLNLGVDDIQLRLGEGISLGKLRIGTTPDLRMYSFYYGEHNGRPPFSVDSFHAVLSGRVPADKFRDKLVLIGASASGVGDNFPTPVAESMPPVLALAHAVSSILQEDFFTRPEWAPLLETALVLLLALYLILLLPRLGAGLAAGISLALLAALIATQFALMTGNALWLKLMIPAVFLVTGHVFMTVKQFRVTERLKLKSEAESAESNKTLGLAFQGQGQLDMAFEKFQRVQPVDQSLLGLMYNLALDFERKRQFNKAESVYQTIARHDPKFKDVGDKLKRARQLSETVILGGAGGGTGPGGTLVMEGGGVEKPMLGRYQVEKELGRGAMGMVYLGKDPKIGRTVAIKTMALSQEFEASEVGEVKMRFFREAETAGRLQHPNIVTIFDAGEDHDLAYIAMEFIKGHDLTRYVKLESLLPAREVMQLIADAADALDYAHAQGVVHRDIKPANLMYLPEERKVKVTDFGVARLTDSSKTKTGMVLGTPSYMSPEQLAGKHVDGRSDLFSLGVTLYQLLTGSLPFTGDSMATLMYRIANEPHAPPRSLNADLPACVDAIIDKVLQKNLEQRYQRGSELAADLRACLQQAG
jgi:CHASE2 domain-containing sensor protein/predicted Ser/Thr protein kinase